MLIFFLQDQEYSELDSVVEENAEKESSGEVSKKKKKVKIKQQEEKKKKKLKTKRKGSLGEFTDEEYDEQRFVEEIKQLPKRNRHAPRRYVSTYILPTFTKLFCFHPYTATTNEKLVGLSGI